MGETGMPWSVVNMGSEMIYILEQRLQAQSISEDKASRVLQDVVTTMFSETFLGELFKPQRLYSQQATRQIFDQLAHSSIMRLNSASMDKLYDLMSMAAKYQLMLAPSPFDLPQIAYNHIDALKKLHLNTDAKKRIDQAANQLTALYSTFAYTDYFSLRQALMRFYQDKRVKVSLFLQEQLQLPDGNIACTLSPSSLPPNTALPGRVTYYDDSGKETRTETLKLANAVGLRERTPTEKTELGFNLYAKDKRKKARAAALAGEGTAGTPGSGQLRRLDKGQEEYNVMLDDEDKKGAKNELSALAQLIGRNTKSGNEKDKLTIDRLFPALGKETEDGDKESVVIFDSEDKDGLVKRMGDLEFKEQSEQEDDLLDLMDKA